MCGERSALVPGQKRDADDDKSLPEPVWEQRGFWDEEITACWAGQGRNPDKGKTFFSVLVKPQKNTSQVCVTLRKIVLFTNQFKPGVWGC